MGAGQRRAGTGRARWVAEELGVPFDHADNDQLKGVSRVDSLEYILRKGNLELDNDTNLPRITPGRYGVGLDYDSKTWLGSVEALRASRQDNEGPLEDETAGYTDLTAFLGYRLAGFDDSETMVYLRGDNLLDDEIVRSTSFLRVAQPGRSVIAGVNVKF